MIMIIGDRQSGRTTRALEWMQEQIAAGMSPVLVVRDSQSVQHLQGISGIPARHFLSIHRAGHDQVERLRGRPWGVDDWVPGTEFVRGWYPSLGRPALVTIEQRAQEVILLDGVRH